MKTKNSRIPLYELFQRHHGNLRGSDGKRRQSIKSCKYVCRPSDQKPAVLPFCPDAG